MPEDLWRLYMALLVHCAAKPGAVGMQRGRETLVKGYGRAFAFVNPPTGPCVTVKASRAQRRRLRRVPAVRRARWVGWLGWVTVCVDDDATLQLAFHLIDRSYERRAMRREP
jgi:predicted DNA-binding protein (MmcQ/YjbR family)